MSLRKITSLVALLAFIALSFSGAVAYFSPRGPGSSNWKMLGLDKHEWFGLHTNLGILFLIAGIVHTILNIKPIMAYLKNKGGRLSVFTLNFNIALLSTVWVILGSVFNWPPFSGVASFKESLGNRGRHHEEAVEPETKAYPDKMPLLFSRRALSGICDEYSLDQDKIIQRLENNGITAKSSWSVKKIAEENDTDPSVIFEAVRQMSQ